jgi:hypothetical protein
VAWKSHHPSKNRRRETAKHQWNTTKIQGGLDRGRSFVTIYSIAQQILTEAQQRWFAIFTQPTTTNTQEDNTTNTQEDVIVNTHLAANEAIGDPLEIPKPTKSSRFYFINPNGFQLNASGGTFAVDHIGITEHKLDGHQSRVQKICHDVARREFEHYRIEISSSDIPTETSFKPGGTLSLTIGSMTALIQSTRTDPMGWFSYTKLVGTRGKIITVITAYQVCNTPVTTTSKKKSRTASTQQASMMRQQGITGTHPRKQFRKDLLNFLQACKA